MNNIDKKDREILDCLRQNARMKYILLGKKVGLSEAAVRFRVKKLLKEGTIRRFTIETGIEEPEAIVLIKTNPSQTIQTSKAAKKISGQVFELSGEYDVAVFLRAASTHELNELVDKIRELPGVMSTNTLLRLTEKE